MDSRFQMVFNYQPSDTYACVADIGWITGHSYITYGPLANGATSVLVSAGGLKLLNFLFVYTTNSADGQSVVTGCRCVFD